MEKVLFKSEEKRSAKEVASVLKTVADKVESGRISLSHGQQEIQLSIPASITLEIKVEEETKAGKSSLKKSLEIELEWYKGDNGQPAAGEVRIS